MTTNPDKLVNDTSQRVLDILFETTDEAHEWAMWHLRMPSATTIVGGSDEEAREEWQLWKRSNSPSGPPFYLNEEHPMHDLYWDLIGQFWHLVLTKTLVAMHADYRGSAHFWDKKHQPPQTLRSE